jgi:cysteine sulfinate desulfinase/cysteine desulfurase-like protein
VIVATYLDHAATTPMRKSAIDAMAPFQDVTYANPTKRVTMLPA